MRYHFEKPSFCYSNYGLTYHCDHPVYDACTLFKIKNKGLAVIQQRVDSQKRTWWSEIDKDLADILYLHPQFKPYFDKRAAVCSHGLYPTVTIRQIMWALKLKPLKKESWETVFDHRNI